MRRATGHWPRGLYANTGNVKEDYALEQKPKPTRVSTEKTERSRNNTETRDVRCV